MGKKGRDAVGPVLHIPRRKDHFAGCTSEVGKIRITGYVGDYYLEAVVIKGNIKDDDVAIKPNSACIIRLPEPEDK